MQTWRVGVIAFGLVACGGGSSPGDGGGGDGRTPVVELRATGARDLDVLFVIDDSGSMADKQANLVENFPNFVNVLSALPGGLPNLHLGVVTTDLGTAGADGSAPAPAIGTVGQGGCAQRGKDGALQTSGASVTGSFLSDVANPDGTRLRNYTGDLSTAFSQMARVGVTGCGFEQPLQAMRRALENTAANAGFLRADAALAIVILADEDDCSVETPALFTADTSTLGPLNSFRCTRFGITCATGGATPTDMNRVGAKDGCTGRGSTHLVDVIEYRDFLRGLKGGDVSRIAVAAIVGDPMPFVVELRTQAPSGESPALAHSCTYQSPAGMQVADPGVRLAELAAQFPDRGTVSTICQPDLSLALTTFGEQVTRALGNPCITVPLADVDDDAAGLQPDCIVEDVINGGASPITACDASATPTCWRLVADPLACPAADNLRLEIVRAGEPNPATVTRARCRTL